MKRWRKLPDPVEPSKFYHATQGWNDTGMIVSVFGWTSTMFGYQKPSFFKREKLLPEPQSGVMIFTPFDGVFYLLKPPTEQTAEVVEWLAVDPFALLFDSSNLIRYDIDKIAPFETVSAHQWTGISPIEIRHPTTKDLMDLEPACWDVATVYNNDRMVACRCHNPRDDVFALTLRLNERVQYWQSFHRSFSGAIREDNPSLHGSASRYPEGSAEREAAFRLYEEMADDIETAPPPFFNGWNVIGND